MGVPLAAVGADVARVARERPQSLPGRATSRLLASVARVSEVASRAFDAADGALAEAGVLAEGAKTAAYTYIGEKITWDIYWHGTIGAAKKDLDHRVEGIRGQLMPLGGDARVSVLKAVVTQASAAIPAMPIYLAILFKVMKALKMSIIHVLAFIVSWTPYTVMGTWLVQHHHSKHDRHSLFSHRLLCFTHCGVGWGLTPVI